MRCFVGNLRVASVVLIAALLAGCAVDTPRRDGGANVKETSVKKALPTQTTKSTRRGRVEAVREVMLMDKKPPNARSMAGSAANEGLTQTMTGMLSPKPAGLELVVRLDSGADITVLQAADVAFRPGDRVRVIHGADGEPRVTY